MENSSFSRSSGCGTIIGIYPVSCDTGLPVSIWNEIALFMEQKYRLSKCDPLSRNSLKLIIRRNGAIRYMAAVQTSRIWKPWEPENVRVMRKFDSADVHITRSDCQRLNPFHGPSSKDANFDKYGAELSGVYDIQWRSSYTYEGFVFE